MKTELPGINGRTQNAESAVGHLAIRERIHEASIIREKSRLVDATSIFDTLGGKAALLSSTRFGVCSCKIIRSTVRTKDQDYSNVSEVI